jgi:methylated-DNA-protein-cysteine methyltransferase-like protein
VKSKASENDFFDRVYEVTRLIPFGRVSTYGAIASCIGSPGAARMVGWALNKCGTQTVYVPAHRVVNRKGLLSGKHFFPGENTMKELLENEGVRIVDDQIVEMEKHFWDPQRELGC